MLKDLVLFKRYGRQVVGDIVDDKFSFQDDDVGSVTHRQSEISYITLAAYGNKDEMRLLNPTTYVGKLLNDSITIVIAGSSQQVKADVSTVKLIKFNFLDQPIMAARLLASGRDSGLQSKRGKRSKTKRRAPSR